MTSSDVKYTFVFVALHSTFPKVQEVFLQYTLNLNYTRLDGHQCMYAPINTYPHTHTHTHTHTHIHIYIYIYIYIYICSQNPLIRQGLTHDNWSEKRECRNIESMIFRQSVSHIFIPPYLNQYSITVCKIRTGIEAIDNVDVC